MQIGNYNDLNLKMTRGDTFAFGFMVEGLESQALATAYLTVKRNYDDATPLVQKTLANGITTDDNITYKVRIAPADTASLEVGKYYYDLQIGVNGDIYTILKGILDLEKDVTN